MTPFSPSLPPPMVLKVEFASATASSESNDDDNEEEQPTTDATTDGEEEVDGDDSGDDVQEEQQEVQDGEEEEQQEQQQLATVVGEICDDFEDNDADGLIDLADVEDCAPPATQGTVSAPTTPPPSSVINTTATNSTNNTLTASEITTPPTTANSGTAGGLGPPWDLAKQCIPIEQLPGISPPASSADDPPNLRWYSCPDGLLWSDPPITSNSGIGQFGGGGGQEGGQQQQQPNSASACPPQPTNYYTAPARIINVTLPPSSSSPSPSSPPPSQSTTNPCPPGESSAQTADTIAPSISDQSYTVEANSEGGIEAFYSAVAYDEVDGVATLEPDGSTVTQDNVGGAISISCNPPSGSFLPLGENKGTCTATDAAGNVGVAAFTITVNSYSAATPPPPQTLQAPPPSTTTTTPQGGEQGQQQVPSTGAGEGVVQGQQQQPPPNSATITPQPPPTTTTQGQLQQLQELCTSLQQQQQQLQQQLQQLQQLQQQLQQLCASPQPPPSTTASQGQQPPPSTTASQGQQPPPSTTASQGQQPPLQQRPVGPVATNNPDGSLLITYPTPGVTTTIDSDGNSVTRYPGDIESITDFNGKSVYKYPGGITVQYPDGSILNMPNDGKWTIILPPSIADKLFRPNSDAEIDIANYLPWDEFLWHMVPKPSWIFRY